MLLFIAFVFLFQFSFKIFFIRRKLNSTKRKRPVFTYIDIIYSQFTQSYDRVRLLNHFAYICPKRIFIEILPVSCSEKKNHTRR